MKKAWKVLAAVLVISCLAAAGCAKDEDTGDDKGSAPEPEYETVGNVSDDAVQMLLTNQTGQEIAELRVKSSVQSEYPANMLRSEQKIQPDETVLLYYTPEFGENEEQDSSEQEKPQDGTDMSAPVADAAINLTYSLQITCADGTIKEATLFPLEDIEEANLYLENDILYLTYKSRTDENEVSTKEAETAAAYDALSEGQKQQVENVQILIDKEIQLENLKRQAAEQQAAAQRAAEQQEAWESSQQNQNQGSQDYDDGGVGQETDNCLGGVAFN